MIFKFKENSHFSTPRCPKFFLRSINGSVKFTNCVYQLDKGDQYDWNKLTGISFNPLNPAQNAIMVGWRWNPTINKVQVCAYFNVNGTIVSPEIVLGPILNANPTDLVNFEINYNKVTIWVGNEKIEVDVPKALKKSYLTSFRIQPYFGGNRPAPNDLELNLNF